MFEFPDVTIHTFRGKHTAAPPDPKRGRPASAFNTTVNRHGFEGHGYCDQYGWLEFFDYLIVAPNNQTIMMCGGIPAFKKAEEMARLHHPDILIRQIGGLPDAKAYAEWIDGIGAQVAFPSHHENIARRFGKPISEVAVDINNELEAIGSNTTFVNPEQFCWYNICTKVEIQPEE